MFKMTVEYWLLWCFAKSLCINLKTDGAFIRSWTMQLLLTRVWNCMEFAHSEWEKNSAFGSTLEILERDPGAGIYIG